MHSAAWVKLFQHIPLSEQAKLMLVTISGTEISIQCFLKIDPECLAIKGRLAGSQDAGRVFFIPYAHIDYFGFQQAVKESEFHEMFGDLNMPATLEGARDEGRGAREEPPSSPAPRPSSLAPSNEAAARNPLSIKSSVLEKFRSRSVSNPGTAIRPRGDE